MSTLNVNKVDPSTGTALEIGSSGDTTTIPSGAGLTIASGATITNSGTATGFGITQANFLPNANPLWINGDMQISQRATSAASITTAGYKTVDRVNISNIMGTWTQTQESLTSGDAFADGFSKSIKMDCTTADASVAADDQMRLQYRFEGQDVQLFKKGTANAEKYTVSFWIKATKTGTNILELYDDTNTRHCSIAYTVSSGDTWEYKVVNFPADTTGAMVNSNAAALTINWWMAAGTDLTSGTLQTTWASVTAANRAVGQVNNVDSDANNFEITGVQLEVGEYTSSTIPPFRFESHVANLLRCERYFQKIYSVGAYTEVMPIGQNYSANNSQFSHLHSIPMVSYPSLGTTGVLANYAVFSGGGREVITVLPVACGANHANIGKGAGVNQDIVHTRIDSTCGTGTLTLGRMASLCANNTTAAWASYDAEL